MPPSKPRASSGTHRAWRSRSSRTIRSCTCAASARSIWAATIRSMRTPCSRWRRRARRSPRWRWGCWSRTASCSWDDPVVKHIPEFRVADPYVTREVTIRDLLVHRTGIEQMDILWVRGFDTRTSLEHMQHAKQVSSLRSTWAYNNVMYMRRGRGRGARLGHELPGVRHAPHPRAARHERQPVHRTGAEQARQRHRRASDRAWRRARDRAVPLAGSARRGGHSVERGGHGEVAAHAAGQGHVRRQGSRQVRDDRRSAEAADAARQHRLSGGATGEAEFLRVRARLVPAGLQGPAARDAHRQLVRRQRDRGASCPRNDSAW